MRHYRSMGVQEARTMNAPPSPARPSGPQRVVIDPRRWVSIRPIERSDEPGLTSFYAQLSPESRRRRFLGFGSPAPAALAAIFTDRSSPGVVGILGEPGPLDGAVVAHASVQPDGIGGAEVAFTVADALQGHGIGRALVAAALGMARSMGPRPGERQHARRQRGDAASAPSARLRRAQRPHGRRRGGGHPPARLLAGPSRSKRPGATGRSALTTVPRRSVHSIRNTAGLRSTDAPHARLLRRLHRHGHPLPRDDPRHRPGDERHGTAVRNARRRFLSAGERGRRPGRRDCDPRLRPRVRAGDGRRAGAGSIHGDLHERRRHRAQRDLRGRHDGQCRRAPVRDRRGRHSGRRV